MTGTHQHSALALAEIPTGRICYVWGILFPLVYLLFIRRTRQDPFLRFHSMQCLLLAAMPVRATPHNRDAKHHWRHLASLLAWLADVPLAGEKAASFSSPNHRDYCRTSRKDVNFSGVPPSRS